MFQFERNWLEPRKPLSIGYPIDQTSALCNFALRFPKREAKPCEAFPLEQHPFFEQFSEGCFSAVAFSSSHAAV